MTEQELNDRYWFWREEAAGKPRKNSQTPQSSFYFWPGRQEKLIFNYELARRFRRKLKLAPFPKLNGYQPALVQIFDFSLLPQLESRDYRDERQRDERGWSRPAPLLQWNLQLPDHTLVKCFKEHLRLERQAQGIPKPVRNLSKSLRPTPWRWLELLDLADFKAKKGFDSGERHALSAARKAMKEQGEIFFARLDQVSPPLAKKSPDYSLEAMFGWPGKGAATVEEAFDWTPPTGSSLGCPKIKLWNRQWPCE